MVDEDIRCCAMFLKLFIVLGNFILFIYGVFNIVMACVVLQGSDFDLRAMSEEIGFWFALLGGHYDGIKYVLAFGIITVSMSFLAYVGVMKESKYWLWRSGVVLSFMILGQMYWLGTVTISLELVDSLYWTLWTRLDPAEITDIEMTYHCCSFNGNSADTWTADTDAYVTCVNMAFPYAKYQKNPQSCWERFGDMLTDSCYKSKVTAEVILAIEILLYFSTQYVIASIAGSIREAKGVEDAGNNVEMSAVRTPLLTV